MIGASRGERLAASGENHPLTLVRLAPRHAPKDRAHAERPSADPAGAKARSARRTAALIVVVLSALVVTGVAMPAPSAQHRSTVALTALDYGVLVEVNRVRQEHGLSPLKLSLRLSESADEHSREMGSDGYFAHSSFDGTTYWKRIEQWYPWSGFQIWQVGENLLWSTPGVTSATAIGMWMRSPEHRANILNPNWREIGIAAVHSDGAPGTFGGQPVTIITTDFGVRATD